MKLMMVNASPRNEGNTSRILEEMKKIFEEEGVEVVSFDIGKNGIRSCIACNSCHKSGKCVFDDAVNKAAPVFEEADGILVGTPVYYAGANPTLMAFLTRLFYSTRFPKRFKVGAAVAVARRSGVMTTLDEIYKFFTIAEMPVVSSRYWNGMHGSRPGEVLEDLEGMQVARTLARNMVFLMKSIRLGKETYGLPEKEESVGTNFIR